jgi:hypothetical protein
VTGTNEATCRHAFRRARQHIQRDQARFAVSTAGRDRLAGRFLAAARDGDLTGLEAVLAEDVVFYGDGGGRAPAVRRPVRGNVRVARFIAGLAGQASRLGVRLHGRCQRPARRRDPRTRRRINAGKLGHLGAVGDLTALLAAER